MNPSKKTSKKIVGVGINDADYNTSSMANGKKISCPYYETWKNMLKRAYSLSYLKTRPTYKDVTVCDEWLSFMNFKAWMEKQDWQGLHLDKDIIKPGNKVYSPELCCFVPVTVNTLFSGRGKSGYSKNPAGKYIVRCCHAGKKYIIGRFDRESEAAAAYIKFKSNLLAFISAQQTDRRISNGLMKHSALLSLKN